MKKIMVYAYTKFNLGDDLFIKILCDRYRETKFVLYAPGQYKICLKHLKNLKCYSSESLFLRAINFIFRILKVHNFYERFLARGCDAGVYIGGSLFIQGDGWEGDFNYHTKTKKIKNKPFFLLGANFGPYTDKDFYEKHKELFGQFTDVCFREKYSYELFNDLPNVRMAADIIFQLQRQEVQEERNKIAISVIKPSYRKHLSSYDEAYYNKIKEIAVCFVEKGYEAVLMSFCKDEGDEEAVQSIMELIPDEYKGKVKQHHYHMNIEETIQLIAESRFIVATRFHSMILGWVYNKPVFPIVYSKKMTNVMDDAGFMGRYTDFAKISDLKAAHVFDSLKTNRIEAADQVKDAEKHFEKLDQFLLNVEQPLENPQVTYIKEPL